ncbi:GNAT family N-acetyltransferase [Actinoalloteichus hymeniacidonis]|uniref:Acetyltransferase (GNAT) family protein n=1 Tax=Actinoalloteichus hymeniacidonis TaxID=340345 RepID=A0AAC9HTG2_9PSEU|nr:N-acetyltransferase [Actinoalloteichus hymeniacidonis]AOS64811.1 acetyltransferase (GNAT) family protein [Actinoalloteichus hymeniacidonis]MBB5907115.1 ribosomal protein S18 acetylase RimI-like enzyme [Actinoalloteichus hymeniacidonis]
MIEIKPALELDGPGRRQAVEVFVDAFGDDFVALSKDRKRLADGFEQLLTLDLFYVALLDGTPASITALTDGRQESFRADSTVLRKHFGLLRGTVVGTMFRREFAKAEPVAPGAASLEFVGTARAHQGKGVAKALLSHLLALPQYKVYVLEEIADTNAPALGLYTRLGFTEYRRRPVKHTRFTGINHYVSMKLVQD